MIKKPIEDQRRKRIDAITNQNKRVVALTNKDDHKDNCKEIFEKLVKERFDEVKELTNKIKHDDLTYYFTGNTARKRFDDVNNVIELFLKIQSGEMKLEEAKKLQNAFKWNLKEKLKGRHKSEEQKMTLENNKFLYESWEAVIKLFKDYSLVVSEAKYESNHGKEILSMLARVAHIGKLFDYSNLEILCPKQMLQRLPAAIAQVKVGNISQNLLSQIRQILYSFYGVKQITKKVYNKIINSITL